MNGIIIDGKVYEVVKGECNKHCPFWSNELCKEWLSYCTENSCFFRYSKELTDKISDDERHKTRPTKV